jgi:SanA protein
MHKVKKWFVGIAIALLMGLLLSIIWSWYVSYSVKKYIYLNAEDVPHTHVGLVLGTAKYGRGGTINLYYKHRLQSAKYLHTQKKIDYLLVSGDNSTTQYNEPTVMKNDLIRQGIHADRIFEDFAGFRTLDSMIRSKAVFGQDTVLVISQKFHVERALFIAHKKGIFALGYSAPDVPSAYGLKTRIREHFARIKLFVDVYLLNTQPKFLGEPIYIPS